MTDPNPLDTTFITDNLINPVKLITNRADITNPKFYLVDHLLVVIANYHYPNTFKACNFIAFKITPDFANIDKVTASVNCLNASLGETKVEATRGLIDNLHSYFPKGIPSGFDEAKLAVYFKQVTPEIIEYFKSHLFDIENDYV